MNNELPYFINYATIQHDPKWYIPPTMHDWHEVIATETGRMTVVINNQTIETIPGDVLFYRAGNPHEEWTHPNTPARTLCLSCAGAESLCDTIAILTHDRYGRVLQMLRWISQEMALRLQEHPHRVAGIIFAILTELAALAKTSESELVARMMSYIHANISKEITIDTLAYNAAMSKYHFIREVRKQIGITPMAEVRRQRLDLARNLLFSTSWPLRTIAQEVGVKNEYHLSNLFRKYYGVSPSVLRSSQKGTAVASSRNWKDQENIS